MIEYFRQYDHALNAMNGGTYSVSTEANNYLDWHYNQGIYKNKGDTCQTKLAQSQQRNSMQNTHGVKVIRL